MAIRFRALTPDDVETRVAQCGESKSGSQWVQLLLYKNARVDMQLLDETVGPENWTKDYKVVNGSLYCTIGINKNFQNPELPDVWVEKTDTGVAGGVGENKSEASDAFKRAGFAWGIGRELYTKIKIFFTTDKLINKNGKMVLSPKESFSVSKMEVDEYTHKITNLEIVDSHGTRVFRWSDPDAERKSQEAKARIVNSISPTESRPVQNASSNDRFAQIQAQFGLPDVRGGSTPETPRVRRERA